VFKEFLFVSDAKYVPHLHSIEETLLKTLQKVWDEGAFDSKVTFLKTQ
jgi:hypothetical protein